jgi:hypothetical protein
MIINLFGGHVVHAAEILINGDWARLDPEKLGQPGFLDFLMDRMEAYRILDEHGTVMKHSAEPCKLCHGEIRGCPQGEYCTNPLCNYAY